MWQIIENYKKLKEFDCVCPVCSRKFKLNRDDLLDYAEFLRRQSERLALLSTLARNFESRNGLVMVKKKIRGWPLYEPEEAL